MAAKNSPNKQGLSKNEAIIQGLQACYKVGVPIIKAVLEANNGHFDKSMKVLEYLSKDQKNVKNKKPNTEKKKIENRINKKKTKESMPGSIKNEGNKNIKTNNGTNITSNNQKYVKKKKTPAVQGFKPLPEDDSWVVVDMKKTGAVPKNKIKNVNSKDSPIKCSKQFIPSQKIMAPANAPSIIRGELTNEHKKKRRAILKSNFDIIKQKSDPVNRIRDFIKFEIKVLILMRGCPGSGKSTFAQEILRTNGIMNVNDHIFSTDNYFSKSGPYDFKPDMLPEAHKWNKSLVELVMKTGFSPVIVDNTNIKAWEMEPYVQYAVRLGYVIETVEPSTPWFFNESILAKKNIHGVSKWKIEQMLSSYEANLTGDTLLNTFKLCYNPPSSPPQLVNNNINAVKNIITKMSGRAASSSKNSVNIQPQKMTKNFSESDLLFPAKPHPNIFSLETDLKYALPVSEKSKIDKNKQIEEHQSILDKPMDESFGGPLLKPSFFSSEPHLFETKVNEVSTSNLDNWTRDLLNSLPNQNLLLPDLNVADQTTEKLELDENLKKLIELFPEMNTTHLKNMYIICQRDMDLTISTLFDSSNPFQIDDNADKSQDEESDIDSSDSDEESGSDEEDEEECDNSGIEEGLVDENKNEEIKKLMKHFPDMSTDIIKEALEKSGGNFNIAVIYLNVKSKYDFDNEDNVSESTSIKDTINASDSEVQLKEAPSLSASNLNYSFSDENKEPPSPIKKVPSEVPLGSTSDQFVLESKSPKPDTEGGSFFAFQKVSDDCTEKNVSEGKDSSKISLLEESSSLSTSLKEKSCGKYGEFISLDNLKQAMSNVLGSLSEASNLEGSEERAVVSSEKTASSLSKEKSELVSNLLSWNQVSPNSSSFVSQLIKCPKLQRERFKMDDTQEKAGFVSSSTNTNYKDFELLKNSNPSGIPGKILVGSPNFQSCNNNSIIERRVLMLDKGTFTEEVELNYFCPSNSSLLILEGMFPKVPKDDLSELLTSCGGDVNWVVGLLLDSGLEISAEFNNSKVLIQPNDSSDLTNSEEKTKPEETSKCEPQLANAKSKKKKSTLSDSSKLAVENLKLNFVMNDNSDSSNLRKVRNLRHKAEEASSLDISGSPTSEVVDDNTSDVEEGDLSIPIGTDLVKDLQAQFGGLLRNKLEDGKVMVNIPVQLARQLHSYIMDSLDQQFEEEEIILQNMISEDESLAQMLHEVENGTQEKQPSLQEIMDNELALNLHKSLNRDTDKGNTIASKLSEQLLIERFPRMDPSTLKAILEDTDHSLYQATNLLEAAGYTPTTLDSSSSVVHDGALISREEAVEQANAYREAAKVFIDLKKECLAKAEKAYSEGMKSVASYYSQMARWHDERIEQANLLASTILLDGNKDATTLDLHFLRVREAAMVLDLFLDAHIRNLIEMNARKRDVYVITGRGIHSTNGKSKIKPVVINKLRQRNMVFRAVNPGLYMVTINSKSTLTCHN